ncbi:MAG: hypothetical protein Unbinned4118contig1001_10 [Prokaryotic dsDNA virus sp.]|jgi:Holliday junction resolvase RusA-like endonuclease|nr:MAG: hypothetical protein Unbinned4118contig1001_10 [Prokaryotic dsDNA virus sp.]|tara:strand:+ start:300 stop:746 length:447 start_codon:yes stop_codon:yes gene_type:complete
MIQWTQWCKFTVPGDPIPKARARSFRTATGIAHYTPQRTKQYERDIQTLAAQYARNKPPPKTPIRLTVIAIFKRPKYLQKKSSPVGLVPHCVRPDLDNVLKAVKDSLNGILYEDDGQVCSIRAECFYAEKLHNHARTEIIIHKPMEVT